MWGTPDGGSRTGEAGFAARVDHGGMREYHHKLTICLVFVASFAFSAPALAAPSVLANGCNATTAATIVTDTNDYRASLGLSRLTVAPKLSAFAKVHSLDMAANANMTHSSSGGLSFAQRARASSYRFQTMRENIALESAPLPRLLGSNLMTLWKNSAPHDANMRATDVSQIGVAVAPGAQGCYASMDLGKPL
jgi:uncharacterized protein YkwD